MANARPDLDALQALLDKATPRPWRRDHVNVVTDNDDGTICRVALIRCVSDADAIVAAVNALPALIARVRELERERDDIREMLQNTNRDAARLANIAYTYKWQVRDTCTRAERAEAERDQLRGMLNLVMAIPTMTDAQLEQLRQNALSARAKVKP